MCFYGFALRNLPNFQAMKNQHGHSGPESGISIVSLNVGRVIMKGKTDKLF